MSEPTQRPAPDDDLAQAYAQAHRLADGEHGPAPSVRASVLAAAREVAARSARPPLAPVAPPVADVGRGRPSAWNLSSWRVRAGAALCAVLLVGLSAVRFDARRHAEDNVTLAAADQAVPVQAVPAPPPPAAPEARALARSMLAAAPAVPPSPLHAAAGADDVDALARLLADPATRVDAPDATGRTALQVAVAAANLRAVRMLLAAGADPDHPDASGATPRSVARAGASADVAALLGVAR